ncbi:MAG: UPF0261 family protein [Anaerolineae bacterium]|nr:UPF0261 family protein [Anaerolineae bacterium]NIN97082.1 UPF0261 family protein [Anaerolineae bacterium]NIQ80030.1 UPF0261 family protein [Anaerolineae bacterium]
MTENQDPSAIVIVGTLDTKGEEVEYLKASIENRGLRTIVVDVGVLDEPMTPADITRERIAEAGGVRLEELVSGGDRRRAVQLMMKGAGGTIRRLHEAGEVAGVVGLGGGTGTHIGAGVLRTLPLGVPKLLISTVASRDMSEVIGTSDIAVMHSVIDMVGLNTVSKKILDNAAGAIVGMVEGEVPLEAGTPLIGVTSFGFCTTGAMHVRTALEKRGYEMVAFHANGIGGMAMEDLVEQGLLSAVLDFATHEFADHLHDGYCGNIGPTRLEAAGKAGIPQVVVPGGLDCIVLEFDSPETIPLQFQDRKIFWYDFRSGIRTSPEEMRILADTIAGKLNKARGPVKVLIPIRGWSEADCEDGPLYEPETNQAFVDGLTRLLRSDIPVLLVDAHINDPAFAEATVRALHELM